MDGPLTLRPSVVSDVARVLRAGVSLRRVDHADRQRIVSPSRFRSGNMAGVPHDPELAERIRTCLGAFEVREVAMFGGRSFMVHEQLAVAASSDGNLLLRCAPDQLDRLLQRNGARQAEMRGKPMSPGWIRVDADAVRQDGILEQWIDDAVAHAESRSS